MPCGWTPIVCKIAGDRASSYDMLVEMRKLALLAFESVYFSHDLEPELDRIWDPVLKALGYISPGLWIMRSDGAGPPPKEVLVLDMHLYDLIHERRADNNPPDDLLTHLVQALDDDDLVRDQMMTMLIAGHDTSTALLAWTLYLLGAHPEWMAKVQSEIWETLGSQPPTPENTRSLTALDQVIKESLRLYPPIHVGNRLTAREVELMGYTIPAATRLMYSIYLVQRHPDFWEAPDQFQPERFAGGYQTRVAPFTYLPFGGGPRNCIGGSFAQLESRIALARLLQTNRIDPPPDQGEAKHGRDVGTASPMSPCVWRNTLAWGKSNDLLRVSGSVSGDPDDHRGLAALARSPGRRDHAALPS